MYKCNKKLQKINLNYDQQSVRFQKHDNFLLQLHKTMTSHYIKKDGTFKTVWTKDKDKILHMYVQSNLSKFQSGHV